MASLAEIRAKIKSQESRNERTSNGGDNAIFAHWNIPEGSTAVVRFVPDGDVNNTFFWAERLMIRLPFSGIKGDTSSKPVQVQVPCMEMYGDTCPILSEVRAWFKDSSLEELGRKYWKKRSYIFQGFVNENPMPDDAAGADILRRFVISPSIFGLIKDALMDPDIQEMPTDYSMGLDFRITKTTKGQYADYGTSKWSRKESALTEAQQASIAANGLNSLGDFLPKKPTEVEVSVIKEMFEASVDGQPYDVERWGNYFRPFGVDAPAGNANAQQAAPRLVAQTDNIPFQSNAEVAAQAVAQAPAPVSQVVAAPAAAPAGDGKRAEDILAMIRSRQST